MDQGIRSLAACPRTCCAASTGSPCFRRTYRGYRYFGCLSRGYFSRLTEVRCSAKFLKIGSECTWRSDGQFCPRGKVPLALQWIVRSGRPYLRYRFSWTIKHPAMIQPDLKAFACSGDRYGLISPVEQTAASLATAGWVLFSARPRSSTVTTATTFLIVPIFVEFCKLPSGLLIPEGCCFQRPLRE